MNHVIRMQRINNGGQRSYQYLSVLEREKFIFI